MKLTLLSGRDAENLYAKEYEASPQYAQADPEWVKNWHPMFKNILVLTDFKDTFIPLAELMRSSRGNKFLLYGEPYCDVRLVRLGKYWDNLPALVDQLPQKTSLEYVTAPGGIRSERHECWFPVNDYYETSHTSLENLIRYSGNAKNRWKLNRALSDARNFPYEKVPVSDEILKQCETWQYSSYGRKARFSDHYKDQTYLFSALKNSPCVKCYQIKFGDQCIGYSFILCSEKTITYYGGGFDPNFRTANTVGWITAYEEVTEKTERITALGGEAGWKSRWGLYRKPSVVISNVYWKDY